MKIVSLMASNTKYEKTIIKSDTKGSHNAKRCTLEKRKEPTPKLSDLKNIAKVVPQSKNHVHKNITSVKNSKATERPPIVQDSCDGHRQHIERAGLKLQYVFKKEYGEVPKYIRKKRHEQEKRENLAVGDESPIQKVAEEEKQAVLKGLKNNAREVEKLLLSLPLIIDTISKQKYKKELEARLLQLQQDIEILENHDVFVLSEKK